jgi:hypothetical protein
VSLFDGLGTPGVKVALPSAVHAILASVVAEAPGPNEPRESAEPEAREALTDGKIYGLSHGMFSEHVRVTCEAALIEFARRVIKAALSKGAGS